MDLYKEPVVILEIRKDNLLWLRHVERISGEIALTKMFKNISEKKNFIVKSRRRSWDDVQNDRKKMGVRGWRKYLGRETPGK
jgi:hypothetical protein